MEILSKIKIFVQTALIYLSKVLQFDFSAHIHAVPKLSTHNKVDAPDLKYNDTNTMIEQSGKNTNVGRYVS